MTSLSAQCVGADPKWAAVIGDQYVPLARQVLTDKQILHQAGAPVGAILVRDHAGPNDVAIASGNSVDLTEGNVFHIVMSCGDTLMSHCSDPPKFAFFMDEHWEVTTNPSQTPETLRGLFGLPDDVDLVRDYESPHDEIITASDHLDHKDGPVFRSCRKQVTVVVNNREVRLSQRRITGGEVKRQAIEQGVPIDLGCILYMVDASGGLSAAIRDDEDVVVSDCTEFRCVAPDDNS